ncbi:DUF4255 domain-containing protein [Phormidium sp. FACHB-592]|uniref:DUF4255 domain-containing protein n=1 Tax=Stenomitos frigidus AS-A4 TaxID=2933935 RepID=A0ABV0KP11_9CYAN|nr:Pvc16 family protein [Phormidium sp. FACHB-592]MBD2072917.1 DUF4255 domain-containing protein [Phormidium sp. FACHB-592]
MISAASQTLARLLAQGLAQISQEQISFEHPQLWRRDEPGLNLYCYHVQHTERLSRSDCRWFDLTFLVGVTHYTRLGEQSLFSEVLSVLSHDQQLPDAIVDHTLRGYGALQMRVFTQAPAENVVFWTVLRAPLQLALHVTLTVPQPLANQSVPVPKGLTLSQNM